MTLERGPQRRIRVLMVMPSYYPVVGGMEIQVERLIPFLRKHGVDVSILTRRSTGTTSIDQRDGVEIRRMAVRGSSGLRSISFAALGISDTVRHRDEIDILHAHSIMSPMTISAIAGVILRKPRIVTVHQAYETDHLLRKPFGAQRLHLFREVMDRFVSISSDIERLLIQNDVPKARIVSIPNGIDTRRFSPTIGEERVAQRERLGLPVDSPIVVFAGRLRAVKNVDVLLRAWMGRTTGYLVILGDGEERRSLENLASDLNLRDRVTFRGMVSNVDDYLRVSDIFVLPSSSEGLSVALLEAMASGLVPVATAISGTVDVIEDQKTGLLVVSGDVDGLRTALDQALSSSNWRAEVGQRARQLVVANHDQRVIAGRLASLYREVATGRGFR